MTLRETVARIGGADPADPGGDRWFVSTGITQRLPVGKRAARDDIVDRRQGVVRVIQVPMFHA